MQQTEHRSFEESDEVRAFPSGHADILNVGEAEIGRLVFEPGWRWSKDVKPIAGTDSCEAPTSSTTWPARSGSGWTTAGRSSRSRAT